MTISAVVVGLGKVGLKYDLESQITGQIMTHVKALIEHPGYTLLGAVDTVEENRVICEAVYGVSCFEELSQGLFSNKPDLVVVATPTETHLSVLTEVLNRSTPRAVLLEKPLAYSLTESRKILQLCDDANVSCFVNYTRRSLPEIYEIKDRISATESIGHCWYSKGLFNNASHFINLCQLLLGDALECRIISSGRRLNQFDVEPDFYIKFERGRVAFSAAIEENFSLNALDIVNSLGRLIYDQGGIRIHFYNAQDDLDFPGYRSLSPVPEELSAELYKGQWHVVDQIARELGFGDGRVSTVIDAFETLRICSQILDMN